MNSLYFPTINTSIWSGRADALENEYVFQNIQFLDLNIIKPASQKLSGYGLLGFACDAGVTRNLGNPGAAEGPMMLRQILAKLPQHTPFQLYDCGNVICVDSQLEAAQAELGAYVAKILSLNLIPIIIGGGHETAWGHFQGIAQQHPGEDIAILNFDAHFDMRPLIGGTLGSSGTPFTQINHFLTSRNQPFNYYCAGIQPFSNTPSLFEQAKTAGVTYLLAQDIQNNPADLSFVEQIIDAHQHIYVSICLDVFGAAYAPGVSAPQALGIAPAYVINALRLLQKSGKVISLDIVELAPKYDLNAQTTKLAASLLMTYLTSS